MAKVGLSVPIDKTADLIKAVKLLTTTKVMVGVPSEDAGRNNSGPISNAYLALIHDQGAPEANIPARPFMKPGIEAVQDKIEDGLKKAGEIAFTWGGTNAPQAVERQFHRIGMIAQSSIKNKIRAGIPPPLAPSTIKGRIYRVKSKKRRKRLKDLLASGSVAASRQEGYEEYSPGLFTPLIVSGQLLNAITYVLRKVKGL